MERKCQSKGEKRGDKCFGKGFFLDQNNNNDLSEKLLTAFQNTFFRSVQDRNQKEFRFLL